MNAAVILYAVYSRFPHLYYIVTVPYTFKYKLKIIIYYIIRIHTHDDPRLAASVAAELGLLRKNPSRDPPSRHNRSMRDHSHARYAVHTIRLCPWHWTRFVSFPFVPNMYGLTTALCHCNMSVYYISDSYNGWSTAPLWESIVVLGWTTNFTNLFIFSYNFHQHIIRKKGNSCKSG